MNLPEDILNSCVSCGAPITFQESPPPAVVPLAFIHSQCQQGKSVYDIRECIECCNSRKLLGLFGGCIVEKRESVPQDQVFVYDRNTKRINRFRIHSVGPQVLEPLSDIVVEKNEEQQESSGGQE